VTWQRSTDHFFYFLSVEHLGFEKHKLNKGAVLNVLWVLCGSQMCILMVGGLDHTQNGKAKGLPVEVTSAYGVM
jgi:hypothetical protein